MNDKTLELKNVWKTYITGDAEINALKDFSYAFREGSFNIIMGPSGSGKSTLIRVAGMLEKPTKGNIFIKGKDLTHLSERKMSSFVQNEIGFIFQNSNLISSLNALENIMLSMKHKDIKKAKELLEKVEFDEFNKYPEELSFYKQLKLAIARAMINNHSLILADEPTGELHTDETIKMMNLLLKLCKNENLTIVMATNNSKLREFAENVIEMVDGTKITSDPNE